MGWQPENLSRSSRRAAIAGGSRAPNAQRSIVDAADYYHRIRSAMEKADRRIFIVGWDFDTRIALDPDEKGKGETPRPLLPPARAEQTRAADRDPQMEFRRA